MVASVEVTVASVEDMVASVEDMVDSAGKLEFYRLIRI